MKILLAAIGAAAITCVSMPVMAQTVTEHTTVVTKKPSVGAGAGIVGGAATGAVVGGPVGAVVGGVIGGVAGAMVDPPAEVKTYVRTAKADDVTYQGDIAVGQVLPDTVTVYEVPKYERYSWTYVNGQRILVDHQTRKIIGVVDDK